MKNGTETLIYNDQNMRLTDLEECSGVILPKPLPIQEEAKIELRREMHDKIYTQYIKEFCNDKGDQKTNRSDEEIRGIKKIKKRVDEGGGHEDRQERQDVHQHQGEVY